MASRVTYHHEMPTANGSRTPLGPPQLEIAVIDDSDIVGWLAALTRLNELYMTDVRSMVAAVKQRCASIVGSTIRRLDILDHGNVNGVEIGSDWITMKTVGRFDGLFRQLAPLFAPKGFVHLQQCNAGQNHALLGHFSSLFRVPVYAGTGGQNPVYRFNLGKYERCIPNGDCESDVARP